MKWPWKTLSPEVRAARVAYHLERFGLGLGAVGAFFLTLLLEPVLGFRDLYWDDPAITYPIWTIGVPILVTVLACLHPRNRGMWKHAAISFTVFFLYILTMLYLFPRP